MSKYGRSNVNGFLHAEGSRIVNEEGKEIILEGWGAGNWTNPEGFMVGAPTDIQLKGDIFAPKLIPPRRFDRRRTFHQTLVELCGTEYAERFWPRWYRNHLAEEDIRVMAELGLNSIRLPINAVTLLKEEPGIQWVDDGFAMLDQVIDWCEKYRIYAILDLHAAPGGQSATACDGGYDNIPHLFIDDESWERAMLIWEKLAGRYADRWIVGGYDLLNEPVSLPNHRSCVPKLARFYDEAIARIRKLDKRHMFTLEGSCFSRSNEIFDHDYDPECHNWCIHVHMYDPSPERKDLYPYLLKAREYNVPIWIGEGGSTPVRNAVFYHAAADYGIGFNLWCWKTALPEGVTVESLKNADDLPVRSVGYELPEEWSLVRAYCAGGPKPSYRKSTEIFDQLLENIKYKNCIHNKELIRITRRIAPLELPAVGYDGMPGNGTSYVGNWDLGNLLNYRLEDHTHLTWVPGLEEPRPGFDMYEDENIQAPFDPLEALMLTLSKGEFAQYTIRSIKEGFGLSITGFSSSNATVGISVNGAEMGQISLGSVLERSRYSIALPAGEELCIRIKAETGEAHIRTLHIVPLRTDPCKPIRE